MKLQPFKLERYFAKYEFSVKYLLSSSDCDGLPQKEVLDMADPETQALWNDLKLGYTESQGLSLLRKGRPCYLYLSWLPVTIRSR